MRNFALVIIWFACSAISTLAKRSSDDVAIRVPVRS